MKTLSWLLALVAALVLTPALAAQNAAAPPDAKAIEAQIRRIADQLHPVTGDVRIAGANAVLHLGQDYYFLPANEARLVLVDAWGNPPEAVTNVLGMVFPAGKTFADDTWGAVITYQDTGYVSDDDAESTDYNALMTEMRTQDSAVNAERTAAGFPGQQLIGWAQPPAYDRASHSVVWARNIRFSDAPENTLNYDIRLLGRRGVLSLNMVTVMSKLAETRAAAARFARSAEFAAGERYADYQSGDRVAEYGVAGLIAAGVGATVAKKAGLLALVLAFGKKFILLIVAGIAVAWGAFRRFFGSGNEEEVGEASYYEDASQAGPAMYEAQPEPAGAPAAPPGDDPPPRE